MGRAPSTIGVPFPKNPGSLRDCLEAYSGALRALCALCGFKNLNSG